MLGCLYGQAIGDALGLGSEFMSKEEVCRDYPDGLCKYEQIIQDKHRRRWVKGLWTDDTDMMLCILYGFEEDSFNLHNVASNFKNWFNCNGMGIGRHTFNVLNIGDYVEQPEMCAKVCWDLSRHKSAANGALMRTSVVGLTRDRVREQAESICKLTHYDPRCVGSCVIASEIIHNLVWNDYELTYSEIKEIAIEYDDRILEWIDIACQNEDISFLKLDEQNSMGYTLRTLSAALWAYFRAPDFKTGMLAIVNEGGDADTNAAIACAILGAKFGYSSIPRYYIENLNNRTMYHQKITSFINQITDEKA